MKFKNLVFAFFLLGFAQLFCAPIALADSLPPTISITAPTHSSNVTITDTVIHVTDDEALTAANVTIDSSTTVGTSNFSCSQIDGLTVDCTIDITSSGNLTIAAVDDSTNSITQSENGYSIDNVAPNIVITSPATGNSVNGSKVITFTDDDLHSPLCSIDNVTYINCTSGVTTLSDVTGFNALPEGNFTLYLKDTDSVGNTGSTSETNIVKDTMALSLGIVSIQSSNSTSTLAKVGDLITLTITSSETIQTPIVTIMGHSVTATNTTGNVWVATYTLISGDTDGNVTFSVNYSDVAGNTNSSTSTTDSSAVSFDSIAPTTPTVSIGNPINLANRNNITLNATGENGTTYNVTISDAGSVHTIIRTGTVVGGVITITGLDLNSLDDGTISVSLILTDSAGNLSSAGIYSSTKDTSVPTLNNITGITSNANSILAKVGDIFSLTFHSSETIQTPSVTINTRVATVTDLGFGDWLATLTFNLSDIEGLVPYTISFADVAGNAGSTINALSTITFDRTVPTITSITVSTSNGNSSYAKVGDTITLNFTSSESIQTPTVNIAGHLVTATNTGGNNWTASFIMTSSDIEGLISYSISFTDLAGNTGTTINTNSAITFDMTIPTAIDNTDNLWHNAGQTITLSCSDLGSGCFRIYYTTDGSTPDFTSSFGNSVVFPTDGIYTLKYFSVDNAGNTSIIYTALNQVKVDLTAPTGNWITPIAGSARKYTVDVSFSSNDNLSGVASANTFYKLNNGIDTFHALPASWDTYPLALGNYTLRIVVIDNAGNVTNIDEVIDIIAVILNPVASTISFTDGKIIWSTNHPTTSRIVYDTVSHSNGTGYYDSTAEEDNGYVLNHVVTIGRLSPYTQYFVRVISRINGGPDSIGPEINFRTFSVPGASTPSSNPVSKVESVVTPVKQEVKKAKFEFIPTVQASEGEQIGETSSISTEATVEGKTSKLSLPKTNEQFSNVPLINWIHNVVQFVIDLIKNLFQFFLSLFIH